MQLEKTSTEEMVVFDVDNMVQTIKNNIAESIDRINEIHKTKPDINFHLGRDNNEKLVLLSSISFPHDSSTLTPMEYTERLIALDMLKTVVKKKMKNSVQ